MFRSSSWCSIRFYAGQKRKTHQRSEKSKQMANIMVQYGRPSRSSRKESVRSCSGRTIVGKAIWESSTGTRLEKVFNWDFFCTQSKMIILIRVVDDIKLAGKTENIEPTWKILMKDVDLGEPTSFLDHVYLGCIQRECQTSEDIVDNCRAMFESRISVGELKNYHALKIWVFLHGLMTWKVMPRNAWKDIANWRIKLLNNYTKSQHHALTTTNSRKKKWDLLEKCPKYALKMFWNVYTWHVLDDLIFYGQWTNLLVLSQSGPELATNAWHVWFLTFITQVNLSNIATWETQHNNAD